ncbi:hypothetical protein [Streptomyces sp. NBC_00582]|uniref:hypothetical protein n=1 Tax=Streptomyces sp. NBC_00582 TaxID=2975783 RepID=UPI002E804A69|nr:hypothetical protein [Streptomyces sp. NBC_00582]WUB63863.1 hypothetical protein OG852_27455 [Streptomyces sp. NBC_00582]
MSNLSPDAKAVVDIYRQLTTQVRRIADALSTPVVEDAEATDDDATTPDNDACRTVEVDGAAVLVRGSGHFTGQDAEFFGEVVRAAKRRYAAEHAPADDAMCRVMETRTCPPSYYGPCGDRPCARFESNDPTPWLDGAEAPAARCEHRGPHPGFTCAEADASQPYFNVRWEQEQQSPAAEDMTRIARRRDSLLNLLDRLDRHGTLSGEERALLRRQVLDEGIEANTVRRGAELADAVTAETKKLLERRTTTLRRRAENAETELRTLRTGIRALGGDPTTIQNLWAQLRLRNRQWRDTKRELEQAQADRDGAYRERAQLLALLASLHPSVIAPALDVEEPEWQILYLRIGGQQASWHIAPRDAELFAHVEHVPADDSRAQWDGHTTEEKYAHIGEHATRLYAEARGRVESPAASAALDGTEQPTTKEQR